MSSKNNKQEKSKLHPRNKNRERYDLTALINTIPELEEHVKTNKFGSVSIDFSDSKAVRLLNQAILAHYYGIMSWEFPEKNLCPPIPGRADYIHHIADLLSDANKGRIPIGKQITCFDAGIGASCIYPILGIAEYGWNFIASDIDPYSIESAESIVEANPALQGKVECRLQTNFNEIFYSIINKRDKIDVTISNPPFHSTIEDAMKGTQRKLKNLSGKKSENPELNFAGVSHELVYEGGELKFIKNMIRESKRFSHNCFWFTTLVSKKTNLDRIYKSLNYVEAEEVKTIPLGTGNKKSRIVAWTFLTKEEQLDWKERRRW